MNHEIMRSTKHGVAIIGFIIGYSIMFILSVNGIATTFQNYPTQTKILITNLVPVIPLVGIGILMYWVFWLALNNPKCKHCGKKQLDKLVTPGELGKEV